MSDKNKESSYMHSLIERAEALIKSEQEHAEKAKVAEPVKQKRVVSEEKKEELRERLKLAREKSKHVREMKKNIKAVVKKEDAAETDKKFSEKPIEEKIEKIKEIKESKEVKPVEPKPEEKPAAVEAPKPAVVETPKPAVVAPPPQPPKPSMPKYFLPKMSYMKSHGFMGNPL
jgi:hypothetical protein